MNNAIGENIRKRRLELGLSVNDVCKKAHVSRATWYRYENGEIQKIGVQRMSLIAKVLQIPASDLLGFDAGFYEETSAPETAPAAAAVLTDAEIDAIAERLQSRTNLTGLRGELVELLKSLTPAQEQRVLDFVRGLKSSDTE